MSDFLELFHLPTVRRSARVILFLLKWIVHLLSASVRVFFHRNFGCRYLAVLVGGLLLYINCAAMAPAASVLTILFLGGLLVGIAYHARYVVARRRLSVSEPHSLSPGDPWDHWQRHGYSRVTVQCYIEPAFCFLIGSQVAMFDSFLGFWLRAAAVALFLEEQATRFKIFRRVLDAIDARLDAQTLNASLKQYQQPAGPGAQRSHRAHLPRSGGYPNP